MKIINKPITTYKLTLELTQEEAIKLTEELGKIPQELDYNRAFPICKSYNAKLYMVLSDALQDLDLIEKTPNRKKGDKSYPRLENDEVIVEDEK